MTHKLKVVLALLFCSLFALGQQSDSISLKDLEIPTSPGFILLDKTPTTIERPGSGKALMLSVLNAVNESNGLPQNYAVDFTPFWFFKHKDMTAYKFAGYNPDANKQMPFANLKKVAVSFAIVNTPDVATSKPLTSVSIGMRTNIISIRTRADINDLRAANDSLVSRIKDKQDRLIKYIGDVTLSFTNPTLYDQKVREFYAAEDASHQAEKNEIAAILKRKALFAIDGAAGYNSFYPGNTFADAQFGRMGAWITMSLSQALNKTSGDRNYFNIYALGRFLSDGTSLEAGKYVTHNFIDAGGKAELEFRKLSVGYEYIYRMDDKTNTFRSNGQIKYRISDQLLLTGAFGKNFGDNDNLISMLGINWGISSGTQQPKIQSAQ
jgi:hypothetical protein